MPSVSPEAPTGLRYGERDASFRAAGGQAGIARLAAAFYAAMASRPDARRIRRMHPPDLTQSQARLALFLCGWLGGPRLFQQRYGEIRLPQFHAHLPIGDAERDAWLHCMAQAVAQQPYADDFKTYLLRQLAVPAQRIRAVATQPAAAPDSDRRQPCD